MRQLYLHRVAIILLCLIHTFCLSWRNSKLRTKEKGVQSSSLDYGKAGAIAEEMLSAIHTVTSFGGQVELVERYSDRCNGIVRMYV